MNRIPLSRALILGAALAVAAPNSHGQPLPGATKAFEGNLIKVKNAPAALLAYWLDPLHNPAPTMLEQSKSNGAGNWSDWTSGVEKMTRQDGNGNGPRDLKLPDGIESIRSIDRQNVLRVEGTTVGIQELRKLVNEIDLPIGQVEIEAQIWDIAPAEFARLPLTFHNASRSTAPFGDTTFGEIAFAPLEDDISPVTQQLKLWQTNERARLITAPRVTAVDGLAASIASTEVRVFDVNAMKEAQPEPPRPEEPETDDGAPTSVAMPYTPPPEKPDDNWELGRSRILDQVEFKAMPILHGDLIAVAFQITFGSDVTNASTILRDGQTLPVRLRGGNAETGWARVALIKVRIIRRANV